MANVGVAKSRVSIPACRNFGGTAALLPARWGSQNPQGAPLMREGQSPISANLSLFFLYNCVLSFLIYNMSEITNIKDSGWHQVLERLGKSLDLEATAYKYGAIQRSRKVRNAADLLRIIFAYCGCQMSLRGTAMWSTLQEISNVSDVAVLKRIRNSLPWLQHILSVLLHERSGIMPSSDIERQIFLIDATFMKSWGKQQKRCWRLHMSYHLNSCNFQLGYLTDEKVGEKLEHYVIEAGGIYIADRGYARARQVKHVIEGGADFIIRAGAQTFTLRKEDGSYLRLTEALQCLPENEPVDFIVHLAQGHNDPESVCQARLVAVRNSEDAHKNILKRVNNKARKNCRPAPRPDTVELAKYFFVLTSLPADKYDARTVLNLYRLRWQIEIAFKRLKSLVRIDKFMAKSDVLAKCYITAGLILALLIENEAGSVSITFPFPGDGRVLSLWRLQSGILLMLKNMIIGFLDIRRYLRNIHLLRRNICEPPRKRKLASLVLFEKG
jgi:hypothetical protein